MRKRGIKVSNPYRNILSKAIFGEIYANPFGFQSLQEYPKRCGGEYRGGSSYLFPILTGIS